MENNSAEGYTSEDLLKLDLGKDIYSVFNKIGDMVLETDVAIQDVSFFNKQVRKARSFSSEVRRELTSVLKAKTRAQVRLTSRSTRWEIMMDQKLEGDSHVRSGVSIDDRKARAANDMVILKNAISESKNEVEALKNLKSALDNTLRDFNAQCVDYREQAKLAPQLLKPLPPNGTNFEGEVNEATFDKSVEAIEKRYNIIPDEVAVESSKSESPDLNHGIADEELVGEDEGLLLEEEELESKEEESLEDELQEQEEEDGSLDDLVSEMTNAFANINQSVPSSVEVPALVPSPEEPERGGECEDDLEDIVGMSLADLGVSEEDSDSEPCLDSEEDLSLGTTEEPLTTVTSSDSSGSPEGTETEETEEIASLGDEDTDLSSLTSISTEIEEDGGNKPTEGDLAEMDLSSLTLSSGNTVEETAEDDLVNMDLSSLTSSSENIVEESTKDNVVGNSIIEDSSKSTEGESLAGDIEVPDFGLAGVTTSEAKVSKHFDEDILVSDPVITAKLETVESVADIPGNAEPKLETKPSSLPEESEESGIDDLLADLGVF